MARWEARLLSSAFCRHQSSHICSDCSLQGVGGGGSWGYRFRCILWINSTISGCGTTSAWRLQFPLHEEQWEILTLQCSARWCDDWILSLPMINKTQWCTASLWLSCWRVAGGDVALFSLWCFQPETDRRFIWLRVYPDTISFIVISLTNDALSGTKNQHERMKK